MAILVPVMMSVVDRPAMKGWGPIGDGGPVLDAKPLEAKALPYRAITRQPTYWLLVGAGAIQAGSGAAIATHIVPMAVSWGYDPFSAATLLTAFGVFGIGGAVVFAWLIDRSPGMLGLSARAAVQILFWLFLLTNPPYPLGLANACALGFTAGGTTAISSAAISKQAGTASFSRAFGLFVMLSLPCTVGISAIAGVLYTAQGDYRLACLIMVAGLAASSLLAASFPRLDRERGPRGLVDERS
jgi:MFS family permease